MWSLYDINFPLVNATLSISMQKGKINKSSLCVQRIGELWRNRGQFLEFPLFFYKHSIWNLLPKKYQWQWQMCPRPASLGLWETWSGGKSLLTAGKLEWTRWSLMSLQTQTILWFCDIDIIFSNNLIFLSKSFLCFEYLGGIFTSCSAYSSSGITYNSLFTVFSKIQCESNNMTAAQIFFFERAQH